MLYIDDRLPRHPKILKAGQLLGGGDGPARALAMFLDGLSYTRAYLTDGVVPDQFVAGSALVLEPAEVAKALARVRLWHRIRGGYRVHDFHDWNKSATEIKQIRADWRTKKAAQRHRDNGEFSRESHEMSRRDIQKDTHRDSRARVSTTTTTTPIPGHTASRCIQTDAARRDFRQAAKNPPPHRVLCSMAKVERVMKPSIDYGEWADAVKRRLARQGYAYPQPHMITAALDAVTRSVTPRRRARGR
jgi:hypothetical protein